MRIPITKYGLPQAAVFPVAIIAVMAVLCAATLPEWLFVSVQALLAATLVWVLAFFRDPYRPIPDDKSLLLSPADGKITDIEVTDNDYIEGKAIRIGIFLNIFNVHINRAPCAARVEKITYKPGLFKDARHKQAGKVNEANDIAMVRTDSPFDKILVRQISGAIARRIVCEATPGNNLAAGQKFGMIKFGSRTELYVPAQSNIETLVKPGDCVKAGITALVRYRNNG